MGDSLLDVGPAFIGDDGYGESTLIRFVPIKGVGITMDVEFITLVAVKKSRTI